MNLSVTLTIRKLEQEILAAGHHLCILTTNSGDPKNTNLDGTHPNRTVVFLDNSVPIPLMTPDPSNPDIKYQLGFGLSQKIKNRIHKFEPSIIHITVPDCTCLHVIQYARTFEIPIMGTYHSNIPEYMEHYPGLSWLSHVLATFFRHQYNFLQALYVPTPFMVRHLQDSYNMDQVTNLKVWGRGVDVDHFHPHHASLKYRRSLGIPDDRIIVLWVGRLVNEKRVDIFAKVIRELVDRGYPVHALVVGAGPANDELHGLPNTTCTGWMSPDQLSVTYASSDIFLFPSSVETFGNVTLEAMASGLPVVVESGCSGHLVQHNQNGFACAAGDFDSFLQGTLELVKDGKRREAFSDTSRRMALALEKRSVVRQMLQHYSDVTDEFYTLYSGRHCNRDAATRQPGSFRAGNHPRPSILVVIESIFILIFRMAWNMIAFVNYTQSLLLRNTRPVSTVAPVSAPSGKEKALSSPEISSAPGQDSLSTDVESVTTISDISTPGSLADGESEEATRPRACCQYLRGGEYNTIGDCQLSHTLVKAFLRSAEFQCRLESRIRNGCSCERLLAGRKRKLSVDHEADDQESQDPSDESETEIPRSKQRRRQQQRRRAAPIKTV